MSMKAKRAANPFSSSSVPGTHQLTVANWSKNDYEEENFGYSAQPQLPQICKQPPGAYGGLDQRTAPAAAALNLGEASEAKVPMEKFLSLVRDAVVPHDDAPKHNAIALSAKYKGHSTKDCIELECSFVIQLLSKRWTTVPLLPATVACKSFEVKMQDGEKSEAAVINVRNNAFSLVAQNAGIYSVHLVVAAPFLSKQIRGVAINVVEAVENQLEFHVDEEGARVASDPCTTEFQEEVGGKVVYKSTFPPTSKLTIHVSKKSDDEEEMDEEEDTLPKEEEIVTVEQSHLFGVGEGCVRGISKFEFSLAHGSRNCFEISIPEGVRIMQVTGSMIKRWDVGSAARFGHNLQSDSFSLVDDTDLPPAPQFDFAQGISEATNFSVPPPSLPSSGGGAAARNTFLAPPPPAAPLPGAAAAAPPIPFGIPIAGGAATPGAGGRILKVWLEFATDSSYSLTVESEIEMKSTSAPVALPKFVCRNVNRDKGYVAVEARTNVEIAEKKVSGVAKLDSVELPSTLSCLAKFPILFAYKFLSSSSFSVNLDVKKHKDISVLVATIDVLHLKISASEDKVLFSSVLTVRNSAKQFLRVDVPAAANIWSTSVKGNAVKPAKDGEGRLMIPLEKSSDDETFSVELTYICTLAAALGSSGTFTFSVPSFDIPISHLMVSCFMPNGYKLGEFEGQLKEVQFFSNSAPAPAPIARRPMMNRMRMQPQQQQMAFSNVMNASPQLMMQNAIESLENDSFGGAGEGLMPVRVQVPNLGKEFRFERLLVDREKFDMSVRYKKIAKGWWQRRNLLSDNLRRVGVAVAVGSVAVLVGMLWASRGV